MSPNKKIIAALVFLCSVNVAYAMPIASQVDDSANEILSKCVISGADHTVCGVRIKLATSTQGTLGTLTLRYFSSDEMPLTATVSKISGPASFTDEQTSGTATPAYSGFVSFTFSGTQMLVAGSEYKIDITRNATTNGSFQIFGTASTTISAHNQPSSTYCLSYYYVETCAVIHVPYFILESSRFSDEYSETPINTPPITLDPCPILGADPCSWLNSSVNTLASNIGTFSLSSTTPFSYIADVGVIVEELNQSGTTSIKMEVPIYGRNVTIFDTASTTVYIGASNKSTIDDIYTMVLALMVITYFWVRIKGLLATHT